MKKLVNVQEVEGEGLVSLLGSQVVLFCDTYIYSGELTGVNETDVQLKNPYIVYETGSFADAKWKDAQKIGQEYLYIRTAKIESYTLGK